MTHSSEPAEAVKRVVLVAQSDRSIARNRDGLIRALVDRGHQILCIAPAFDHQHQRMLDMLGAKTIAFRPQPARFKFPGDSFLHDRQVASALAAILADWRADAMLTSGLPALVDAVGAARKANVGRVVALLNTPFDSPDDAGKPVASRRIALALQGSDRIVAHNEQIAREATAHLGNRPKRLASSHVVVVSGAGVDLVHHKASPLPAIDEGLVFLMISSLDLRRGVLDYCHAARELRSRGRRARFLFAGPDGAGPGAIPREKLSQFGSAVEDIGAVDDVRPLLARAHVCVHPAHAEGLPRVLLEALAAGRPLITTDIPGCRELVDERVNGCLVPPRDADALNAAIESFLKRPDLIASASRASRLKAERRCDIGDVNRLLLDAMGIR